LVSVGVIEPGSAELPPEEPAMEGQSQSQKLAVSLFITLLGDADRDLRHAAADALGRLGDPKAETALVRALGDTDEGVRLAVEEALRALESVRAS